MSEEIFTVMLTKAQRHNLLVMLDSVQVKGIQSANEYLAIVSIIQNSKIATPEKEEKING